MAEDDTLRLAELLCSRLCHDLAGPISGAAAGVELLGEEGGGGEIGALLGASVTTAARHLNYYRRAFGKTTAPANPAALRRLGEEFLAGWPSPSAPGEFEWWEEGEGEWPPDQAKLVLNLLLIARDALPRGGRLDVRLRRGRQWSIEVAATGRVMVGEALEALNAAGLDGLTPRGAQAYYAGLLAHRLGCRIEVTATDDGLRLMVAHGEH